MKRNLFKTAELSYIALGADYKMFTLGLRQFWRLLTTMFLHGSLNHLFMNMISLMTLGTLFETKYGHWKMLFTVLFCALIGSLTNGILTGNGLTVGISGGLYGLLAIYTIDILHRNLHDNSLYRQR